VGALSLTESSRPPAAATRLSSHYDVVVVGAGPAGSLAAWTAARLGLSVLLLEKRQEIGSPVRCAEGIAHSGLTSFIEPDPRWIAATVDKAEIIALGDGRPETLRAEGGYGYILERRVFDRVLAEQAAAAGAQVAVKTAAVGLLHGSGTVCGVIVRGLDGTSEIEAQVIIAADGVESQVGRWAGLETRLPLRDTMTCAQYLLAGVDVDHTCCSYFIGDKIAPGGYAWIFPKGEGRANVGLGVQADLVAAPDSALACLHRFIESQPRLAQGSPVTLVTGGVPVALPPRHLVANGLMLVGDAARQVDPLTGGGMANGMVAGRLAAEVAVEAIAAGDVSAARLAGYEARWAAGPGEKMARHTRWRERFPPGMRASRNFLRIFAVAAAGG
jgi:digeranylgeranylglycerophospholipid reductase